MTASSNFAFLAPHAPLLADLGANVERLFPFDRASCVLNQNAALAVAVRRPKT